MTCTCPEDWQGMDPGWLKEEMDDIATTRRANAKVLKASAHARSMGFIQPVTVTFSAHELHALARLIKQTGVEN